jgi:hypothetical protein
MRRETPTVGVPYTIGAETLIPTYVKESEAPRKDGGCLTHDYTRAPGNVARSINAAGWYVEFHYPDATIAHRRFISFDARYERGEK